MVRKRMRSKLHQVGIATLGLSLSLFGCPPTDSGVDDGANSGLPGVENPAGGSGGDAARAGGGSGVGGGGTPSGGENTSGGSGVVDRSAIVRPASPTLFVADPTIGVMSFSGADALDGNVAPTTFIDSFERLRTTADQFPMTAQALCVDRVGTLVISDAAPSLRFYNSAATVTGIPAPDREIQGSGSRLADNGGMAYDRDNDRLLVASSDRVLIFEGAGLSQSGEVAPSRFFSSPDLPGGGSIALGPNGDLYVTDSLNDSILVFSNAGLRTGEIRADRVIQLFIISEVIYVDLSDHLYVAFNDRIAVVDNASTLDGEVPTFREMRLAGVRAIDEQGSASPEVLALAVDSRGVGFAADNANAAIHVVDNIATRTGDIRADRAITGPAVRFDAPFAIFLWE